MLTPQHLTRLGILPDLSVAPERAAQKSSSSGSLREQMLVGTVCFMCLENVCAFGIPHPCSCGRETRRVRVGTSGYEWVRVGTSGHEWVRVGASGYEWVRVGTSGYEWVRRCRVCIGKVCCIFPNCIQILSACRDILNDLIVGFISDQESSSALLHPSLPCRLTKYRKGCTTQSRSTRCSATNGSSTLCEPP